MKTLLPLGLILLATASAEVVDIASRGTASQSTEWNGGQYPAANAIDGNSATFSHTDLATAGNAWRLSFDQDYPLTEIILIARGDCCANRLNGSTLRLSDAAGSVVFTQAVKDPGVGLEAKIALPAGTKAKLLSVAFEGDAKNPEGNRALHLAEVKVLADIALGPTISLAANKTALRKGEALTLSWKAPGGVEFRLLPKPGDVGAQTVLGSGQIELSPTESQRFTLFSRDATGWGSASVVVHVDGQPMPPRITEFLADNDKTLKDGEGESPAWVEIHNADDAELDLAKWFLTTDKTKQKRIPLPAQKLSPNAYALLFLGQGAGQLPLDLADGLGSYLALLAADGAVSQEFSDLPKQRTDVSFGIDQLGQLGYFTKPSPQAANTGTALAGFVGDTKFSVDGGFFTQAFDLVITCATPEAKIYFTLNGTVPSPTNSAATLYAAPVKISGTTALRAVALREGYGPSNIDSQSYIFLPEVIKQPKLPTGAPPSWGTAAGVQAKRPAESDYEMDPRVLAQEPWQDLNGQNFTMIDALKSIPTMSLVMDPADMWDPKTGIHINARKKGRASERPASLEYFTTDGKRAFRIGCGVRVTGGWGRYPEMLKKSFRLYFRGEYGASELKYPLFLDSEINSYDVITLRGGNGKAWPSPWRGLTGLTGNTLERTTYLRDEMIRRTQRDLGQPSVHGNFVHLYINGYYWGLYNPCERINDAFAAAHFGGKPEDYDVVKWIRSEGIKATAGSLEAWTNLMKIARKSPETEATFKQVEALADLHSLIDYMMPNIYAGNVDWQDNNAYVVRHRNAGRFRFLCWDGEETFLAPADSNVTQAVGNTAGELFSLLRRNPEFRLMVADHVQKHYFGEGALTDAKVDFRFMEMAKEIDRAIVGESARWGDLMRPSKPYDRAVWLREIDNLRKNYWGQSQTQPVRSRRDTTLKQFTSNKLYPVTAPPLVEPAGGRVEKGASVSLGKASVLATGVIYYTTDGSDPRLFGGAPSPNALSTSQTTLSIEKATTLKARLLDGSDWSALVEAKFIIGVAPRSASLFISEIMYHPADEADAEYIELHNASDKELSLAGLRFTDGIGFDFPDSATLAPGERAVLVSDAAAFAKRHGNGVRVLGQFAEGSALNNGGEELTLRGADGQVLQRVRYGDSGDWPKAADGQGASLILSNPTQAAEPRGWRASALGGSPGRADGPAVLPDDDHDGIPNLIQEVLAGSGPLRRPSAELEQIAGQVHARFTHTQRKDLAGWKLSVEESSDLRIWEPAALELVKTEDIANGLELRQYRRSKPLTAGQVLYFRLKVAK